MATWSRSHVRSLTGGSPASQVSARSLTRGPLAPSALAVLPPPTPRPAEVRGVRSQQAAERSQAAAPG